MPSIFGAFTSNPLGQLRRGGMKIPADTSSTSTSGAFDATDILDVHRPVTKLPHWRAALARMRLGGYNPRLLLIGDSTTFGTYSTGSNSGEQVALSWPTTFTKMLNAHGIPAQCDSVVGDGSYSNEAHSRNDARMTMAGGWSISNNNSSGTVPGGQFYQSSSAGNLSFTPYQAVDTFIITWINSEFGSGVIGYNFNGSNAGTINTGGSAGGLSQTVITAPSLSMQTLNLFWSSGSAVYVAGIEGYNSKLNQISVLNAGWAGSKASDWSVAQTGSNNNGGYSWAPTNNFKAYKADLTLICLGINDWVQSESVATYTTDMQAIITAALLSVGTSGDGSDVALVTPAPSQNTTVSLATQKTYIHAIYALALTNGIPVIDNWERFVSYEVSNPLGYYGQSYHPRDLGYADFAQGVFDILLGDYPNVKIRGAGLILPISTQTANYTTSINDFTILCNGTFTVTLTAIFGQCLNIKNIGAGTITVSGTVDTTVNPTIAAGANLQIQYDGSVWRII